MNKIKYIILGVVVIIFLFFFMKKILTKKSFNDFNFPDTLVVNNYTEHSNADTITMVLLHEIFDYDTMKVNIFDLSNFKQMRNTEFSGYIIKNRNFDKSYDIFIAKKLPISLNKILSHEIIHLNQFETGRLKYVDDQPSKMIYEGDTIDLNSVDYYERPFEKDAFSKQSSITRQLNNTLYSN